MTAAYSLATAFSAHHKAKLGCGQARKLLHAKVYFRLRMWRCTSILGSPVGAWRRLGQYPLEIAAETHLRVRSGVLDLTRATFLGGLAPEAYNCAQLRTSTGLSADLMRPSLSFGLEPVSSEVFTGKTQQLLMSLVPLELNRHAAPSTNVCMAAQEGAEADARCRVGRYDRFVKARKLYKADTPVTSQTATGPQRADRLRLSTTRRCAQQQ